jgi:hypothetical protein
MRGTRRARTAPRVRARSAAALFAAATTLGVAGAAASPPGLASVPPEGNSAQPSWEAFTGLSVGLDLRAEEVEVLKHYATADGRSFWDGGPGAGASAALALHFRGPAVVEDDGRVRWIDFELAAGDATHYVRWRDGETGLSTGIAETEAFMRIGPRFASGRVRAAGERFRWWGYAVAIDWIPTYVYFFGSDRLHAAGRMNSAGLGLSADFGQWTPGGGTGAPLFRLSAQWLPYVNGLPTVMTAGVGCVWY